MEKEIDIASGTEVRKLLEAKLQFLRQEISSIRHEISSRDQQIVSLRQEICSVRSVQEAPASAGLSLGVPEKLLQELTEYLAEQKAKSKSKKSVQLSSVSQYIWGTLERQVGLEMMFNEIDPNPEHLSDLPAFGWDDRQERSQADRYIPHLNKIASGRKWMLIDAANNYPTLLSGFLGGWNFKGTTDVAFVHRIVLKSDPRRGLKCIFELKKDLRGGRDKAIIQTTIRLVMANVFAQQFRPFAVLTDLDDFWSLYWMDASTIYWFTFESRASAVGYIKELLQDSDNDKMGTSEALAIHARPRGEDEGLLFVKKRRMYEPPEMDNLKDLVGLIPDEEILSARVQLSVQQLEKLLHIPLFSGVPDVDVPWPHSMYC